MQAVLAAHPHILGYLQQGLKTCLWLVLVTAIFGPLEQLFSVRKARLRHKGWSIDFGWYFVNSLTPLFLLAPPAAFLAWSVHQILPAAFTQAGGALPLWPRMAAAMMVGEIGFYWGHRWCHEIPVLWRFHAVHHSARHVNFLVNTRAHPVDMVFTRLCGMTLLYATGLASPVGPHAGLIPTLVLLIGSLWGFFIHANVRWRLGWFEEVLASPAFHHWHHTLEDHKDHNYASMLPFMDRVFGTFYLPKAWPEAYGTATPMPQTLTGQLLQPFAPQAGPAGPATSPGAGGTPAPQKP